MTAAQCLTQEDFWKQIYKAKTIKEAKQLAKSIRILIIDMEDEVKETTQKQIKETLGIKEGGCRCS